MEQSQQDWGRALAERIDTLEEILRPRPVEVPDFSQVDDTCPFEGAAERTGTLHPDGTIRDRLGNFVGIDQPAAAAAFWAES